MDSVTVRTTDRTFRLKCFFSLFFSSSLETIKFIVMSALILIKVVINSRENNRTTTKEH